MLNYQSQFVSLEPYGQGQADIIVTNHPGPGWRLHSAQVIEERSALIIWEEEKINALEARLKKLEQR